MRARFSISVVVVCLLLFFSSPLFAQQDKKSKQDAKSTIMSIEQGLWEAWKKADPEPFRKHLTDNSVSVSPHGVTTGKENMVKEISANPCQVRDYSLSDWQVHEISNDTVVLTYKARQDATCQGTKIPTDVVASSVYVRKGNTWLAASHQETPLMPAGSTRATE